jgi:hypothetical protein
VSALILKYSEVPMKRPICILLIILLMGYSILPAQSIGGQSNRSSAAQYYLGEDDELLVPVNIWGFVRLPGQYFVPNNTNLIALLSFAGGPSEDAKISNIRMISSRGAQYGGWMLKNIWKAAMNA